jgi:hypothetical protein
MDGSSELNKWRTVMRRALIVVLLCGGAAVSTPARAQAVWGSGSGWGLGAYSYRYGYPASYVYGYPYYYSGYYGPYYGGYYRPYGGYRVARRVTYRRW